MPTYELKCRACGKRFSEVMPMSQRGKVRVKCPKCSSRKVDQLVTGFFVKTGKKS